MRRPILAATWIPAADPSVASADGPSGSRTKPARAPPSISSFQNIKQYNQLISSHHPIHQLQSITIHCHPLPSIESFQHLRDSLLGQFLAGVHVGVLSALEGSLQLFQLIRGEGGPRAALLPLQRDPGLRVHVRIVIVRRRSRFYPISIDSIKFIASSPFD